MENSTWYHKIGMVWINSTRNDKIIIPKTYTFFLEYHTSMLRYKVSEHPRTQLFLVGMSDAGFYYHAYWLYLVIVLYDSTKTRVQLLSSITRTNDIHDRTIPYYEMTAIVKLMSENKKGHFIFRE